MRKILLLTVFVATVAAGTLLFFWIRGDQQVDLENKTSEPRPVENLTPLPISRLTQQAKMKPDLPLITDDSFKRNYDNSPGDRKTFHLLRHRSRNWREIWGGIHAATISKTVPEDIAIKATLRKVDAPIDGSTRLHFDDFEGVLDKAHRANLSDEIALNVPLMVFGSIGGDYKRVVRVFDMLNCSKEARDNEILNSLQKEFARRFDQLVDDANGYQELVQLECSMFPEGDLFPYTFPAIAYCCYGGKGAQKKAESLLKLAQANVEKKMHADLKSLTTYKKYGTHLGQFNLALSVFNRKYKNESLRRLNAHLTRVLIKAFHDSDYEQICSYPNFTWTFDSIPALLSIKLNRDFDLRKRVEVVEKHIAWIKEKGTDNATNLPYTIINGNYRVPPRGCDLSLRIPWIYHIDKDYGKSLYGDYCKSFWKVGIISGFKEWANGDQAADIDSGPIILGVGASATAMSFPCFELYNDEVRRGLYLNYLSKAKSVKAFVLSYKDAAQFMDLDERFYTGSLFGDCVIFYSITWHLIKDL